MKAVKSLAEFAFTSFGLTAVARRWRRPTAIVAYHNVVDDREAGRGDASLHMPLSRFIEQIERLRRSHDIVALDAIDAAPAGRRPRAVLTFDDAYRGAVALALTELRKRDMPATVFVAPALLGTASTWWDDLGEAGMLTEPRRRSALLESQGKTRDIRQRWPLEPADLPDSYGIATIDELRASASELLTIGSHSWAHEYLPALGSEELESSLARARQWIVESGLPSVDWLALPYGGLSAEVEAAALTIGHLGVLRVDGGAAAAQPEGRRLPRINVPAGMSSRGLELRTSSLLE